MAFDIELGDLGRVAFSRDALGEKAATGFDHFGTPAVVEGDRQDRACVLIGLAARAVDLSPHGRFQGFLPADRLETDVVLFEAAYLFAKKFSEQAHKSLDFEAGALPVFSRERVKREVGDAEARRGLHGRADRFRAGAVAGDARLAAARGPAAIAVHDDRY